MFLLSGNSAVAEAESPEPESLESRYSAYDETHPYLKDDFSPGAGGESGIDELGELQEPETSILDTKRFDSPSAYLRARLDELYDRTGLRLGFAATALGLAADGAGDPSGAAYDIDFMSSWTLVGRGTPDTGVLVTTAEFRDRMANSPASTVGPELGTLINTVNAFNDRGWVVRDAYWLQRFNGGRVRLLVGRADTSDFFGLQPMQNVNAMFANRSFSANPSVPFPGHGPTVGVSLRPNDRFYVTGGVANGYNNTEKSGFDTIDEGDFMYSSEAGWTPDVAGWGAGRYSVMLWRIDSRNENRFDSPSGDGVTLVAGQQLGYRLQAWARYAYASGGTTNVRSVAQGGVGYSGLLGSPSNMTGFAASYAEPHSDASNNEKVFEVFQRLQLSRFTQLTIGSQVVLDPGNNADTSQIELLYARLRHAF